MERTQTAKAAQTGKAFPAKHLRADAPQGGVARPQASKAVQSPEEDTPMLPAWVYLDRAFPMGCNMATRKVELRAALAPWHQAAVQAAQAAARRVGSVLHQGSVSAERGEALKARVQQLHKDISLINLNQVPSQIVHQLRGITARLERICR